MITIESDADLALEAKQAESITGGKTLKVTRQLHITGPTVANPASTGRLGGPPTDGPTDDGADIEC